MLRELRGDSGADLFRFVLDDLPIDYRVSCRSKQFNDGSPTSVGFLGTSVRHGQHVAAHVGGRLCTVL